MHLRYRVLEAGWAEVTIGCDGVHVDIPVSYLHDSLRDLISAATAIADGAREITVLFRDEPGEHHLNARRLDGGRIALEVITYPDAPPHGAKIVLSCETTAAHFRGQVLSTADAILTELGTDEYARRWRPDAFPLDELARLRDTQRR